jgi:DNA-binding transcriptional regulator YiaG
MTLNDALQYFKTKTALADALGITKQAVSNWADDELIPEAQALKLKYEIIPNLTKAKDTAA